MRIPTRSIALKYAVDNILSQFSPSLYNRMVICAETRDLDHETDQASNTYKLMIILVSLTSGDERLSCQDSTTFDRS